MREIVIVISDLFLPPGSGAGDSRSRGASAHERLPGIEYVTRFASSAPLAQGWRSWVARWMGLAEHADRPAASVAAAAQELPAAEGCWLATALHMTEGLTRVHVDWRCQLRLEHEQRQRLAGSFRETFRGSDFDLIGLQTGEFLLTAPALAPVRTTEPARLPQAQMAESLPSGTGAAALRRLGTEIEMWLHGHPVNMERARRGEPSVSTLWLWGGGEPPLTVTAPAVPPHAVFGSDAYVRGLCCLAGLDCGPMPSGWTVGEGTSRTLCVLRLADELPGEWGASLTDALANLDRRVIAPAAEALRRGTLDRLALLANDRCWSLRAADRWRLWRRTRAGLGALT